MIYNGQLVPKDVSANVICKLKQNLKWADWAVTGFKCGINWYAKPMVIPDKGLSAAKRTISILANNTEICQTFNNIAN